VSSADDLSVRVWRLCKAKWTSTAFDGEGARRVSGRWHVAGTPVVYTASSRSLAVLEMLVNMDPHQASADWVLIPADIPGRGLRHLGEDALPTDWDSIPALDATRSLGTCWVRDTESLALAVPSVVLPKENNVLLNPRHPDFVQVSFGTPEPFTFDPRLVE